MIVSWIVKQVESMFDTVHGQRIRSDQSALRCIRSQALQRFGVGTHEAPQAPDIADPNQLVLGAR